MPKSRVPKVAKGKVVAGYRLSHKLGAGSFAEVWHATHEETQEECAVKVLKRSLKAIKQQRQQQSSVASPPVGMSSPESKPAVTCDTDACGMSALAIEDNNDDSFAKSFVPSASLFDKTGKMKVCPESEIFCTRMVHDHPNIVSMRGAAVSPRHHYLVMELVEGQDMFDLVTEWWDRTDGRSGLPENHARRYFAQLASAVDHMHKRGVAHRDIKVENMMIRGDDDSLLLTDFGFATVETECCTKCGTLEYLSPEVLLASMEGGRGFDPKASDVFACGVSLYCMLTTRLPFDAESQDEIKQKIFSSFIHFPAHVSADAQSLIRSMMSRRPTDRPTMEQVLQHPFVTGRRRANTMEDPPSPCVQA